ncbi:MAG TPA: hypothetical protein DCG79_01400 [Clostridiales bacterium]|nr:hypothetical protein [Clostridiales bacterium]
MKKKEKSEIGGFAANSLIIPLAAVLAAVIVCITVLTMSVNRTSSDLTDLMQQTNEYQRLSKNMQGSAMVLSGTTTSFMNSPLVGPPGQQQVNVGPLRAYVAELKEHPDQRGPEIAAKFKEMGASEEVQGYIEAASQDAEQMRRTEEYAIALILYDHPLYDLDLLEAIPTATLTDEDLALTADERLEKAKKCILEGRDYSQCKSNLAANIDKCTTTFNEEFSDQAEDGKKHISTLRIALWVMIGVLAIAMMLTFMAFYRWIIGPMRQYAQQINSDQVLKRRGAIRELRSLVLAHNDLLRRRNKLETILRTAAETDALTGLPNRYSLERYALEIDDDDAPLAVMLFDVNFLKKVNDTQGHLAGDQLLRTAALCIRESFSSGTLDNCYRFGGDEFAAILRDCNEEDIKNRIERFNRNLEREKISVSVGYAYTDEIGEGRFKRLMALADKRMYAEKRAVHKREEILGSEE